MTFKQRQCCHLMLVREDVIDNDIVVGLTTQSTVTSVKFKWPWGSAVDPEIASWLVC